MLSTGMGDTVHCSSIPRIRVRVTASSGTCLTRVQVHSQICWLSESWPIAKSPRTGFRLLCPFSLRSLLVSAGHWRLPVRCRLSEAEPSEYPASCTPAASTAVPPPPLRRPRRCGSHASKDNRPSGSMDNRCASRVGQGVAVGGALGASIGVAPAPSHTPTSSDHLSPPTTSGRSQSALDGSAAACHSHTAGPRSSNAGPWSR